MATQAQIDANRRNAQKSTGPRTDEGKAVSRRNSLKHGLCGEGIVQPARERESIARRAEEWTAEFQPTSAYGRWLVGQLVLASIRMDRCIALDIAQRDQSADRAAHCWDGDRHLEAEERAVRLAKCPALIVRHLRRTSQGCDWLIARWRALQATLAVQGGWDDEQRALAFDLLGIPPRERLTSAAAPANEPDVLSAMATTEIEALEALKADALDDLDADDRERAEEGLAFDTGPSARLLRRYEADCRRLFDWAKAQLGNPIRQSTPTPATQPAPAPRPRPLPPTPPRPTPTLPSPASPMSIQARPPIAPEAAATELRSSLTTSLASAVPSSPPRNRKARRHLAKLSRSA